MQIKCPRKTFTPKMYKVGHQKCKKEKRYTLRDLFDAASKMHPGCKAQGMKWCGVMGCK